MSCRVLIVKPKINEFLTRGGLARGLLFDASVAGRDALWRSRSFHITLDGQRVGISCLIGVDGHRFGEHTRALGVVAHFDEVAFAGHDRLLWVLRHRATARAFGGLDNEWLVARVGEFELAERLRTFFDGTVVNRRHIERHDGASGLSGGGESANKCESEDKENLLHRKKPF